MTIDLHGLRADEAEIELCHLLNTAPPNIHTVTVIHGIGTGALKNLTQNLFHPRIESRQLCIGNQGQTNLYLKTP